MLCAHAGIAVEAAYTLLLPKALKDLEEGEMDPEALQARNLFLSLAAHHVTACACCIDSSAHCHHAAFNNAIACMARGNLANIQRQPISWHFDNMISTIEPLRGAGTEPEGLAEPRRLQLAALRPDAQAARVRVGGGP